MKEPLYKVGNFVRLRLSETKAILITQIEIVICSAGQQTFYVGKVWDVKPEPPQKALCTQTMKLHEIELGENIWEKDNEQSDM
jgi:hypothetical protein